jgi:hypothetical protein
MQALVRASLKAALAGAALVPAALLSPASAAALPRCTDFATDPALGLVGHPEVSEIIQL